MSDRRQTMAARLRKAIKEDIEDLHEWMKSEDPKFNELVFRILASLPGGERAEDLGYEPLPLGWKEIELVEQLLRSIETDKDVEEITDYLIGEDEEEEED
jgi:hypothetical protein